MDTSIKSVVYVVQETDRNILPAQKYGQIEVIFSYKDVKRGSAYMIEKLEKVLKELKPYDYILCIGDPLAIGLTIHVAFKMVGIINVLRWDNRKYIYYNEVVEIEP